MSVITQNHILNIVPGMSAPVVVHVSQGDSGVELEFVLVNGSEIFDPTGTVISVHGIRQDGTGWGPVACAREDGKIKFTLPDAATAVKGSGMAELSISNGEETVGTTNFAILVETATFPQGVTYANDVSVYEAILAYVDQMGEQTVQNVEADLAAEIANRQAADAVLQQNINSEASTRAGADTTLQTNLNNAVSSLNEALTNEISNRTSADITINARIDGIIAPSGEAPSVEEILDSRVGADGRIYSTLGDAIRDQIGELQTFGVNLQEHSLSYLLYENKSIDNNDGSYITSSGWKATNLIPVHHLYSITFRSSFGSTYNGLYRADKSFKQRIAVSTTDYTYVIPDDVYYIAFSNTYSGMAGLVTSFVTKEEHELELAQADINKTARGYIPEGVLIPNEYIQADGTTATYSGWSRTDYIDIEDMDEVYITTSTDSTYNAFYDSNKDFVSRLYTYADAQITKVPAGAKYIRISNTNAAMAVTKIYGKNSIAIMELTDITDRVSKPDININHDVLFLNDINTIGNRITQAKFKRHYWTDPDSVQPVLQLAVITDIHASNISLNTVKQLSRFIEFCNSYSDYLDDMLCLGDVVLDNYTDDFTYWGNVNGAENILNTIGNHDAYSGSNDTSLKPKTDIYNKYFLPYISNWGVTQPANASTNGLCYYYKDYTDNKVRLIVLDCMNYDTAQNNWLIDVLSDAITNELAVVIAQHYNLSQNLTPIPDCNFVNRDYMYSELVIGVNTSMKLSAVDNFINNGGKFVCWLTGDAHYDAFGVYEGEHGKQLSLTFENTSLSDKYNDCARIRGAKSQDSFNFVAIDTDSNLVKVTRVGNCENRMLQSKKFLCYNYSTHQVVSVG